MESNKYFLQFTHFMCCLLKIEKKCVIEDDENARMFYVLNPRSELNKRGYPHWDTSKARELLKKDVENKVHKKMTMEEMQQKRVEYKKFPKKVFAKRVYAEDHKQRSAGFWVHGRNQKAMAKHVSRHAESE